MSELCQSNNVAELSPDTPLRVFRDTHTHMYIYYIYIEIFFCCLFFFIFFLDLLCGFLVQSVIATSSTLFSVNGFLAFSLPSVPVTSAALIHVKLPFTSSVHWFLAISRVQFRQCWPQATNLTLQFPVTTFNRYGHLRTRCITRKTNAPTRPSCSLTH